MANIHNKLEDLFDLVLDTANDFLGEGTVEGVQIGSEELVPGHKGYIIDIYGIKDAYKPATATAEDFINYLSTGVIPYKNVCEKIDDGYFSIYIDEDWISDEDLTEDLDFDRNSIEDDVYDEIANIALKDCKSGIVKSEDDLLDTIKCTTCSHDYYNYYLDMIDYFIEEGRK